MLLFSVLEADSVDYPFLCGPTVNSDLEVVSVLISAVMEKRAQLMLQSLCGPTVSSDLDVVSVLISAVTEKRAQLDASVALCFHDELGS